MSNLRELITELCPNGVEYKRLGDIVSIERGKRLVREQLSEEGKYPVYQNSMTPLGYHTEYNYDADTTFIIGAGAAGEIGYSKVEFWAADDCYPLVCSENISSRYIYHALLREQPRIKSRVRKASIPRLSRNSIEQLKIPVPPIEVQCEIVQILDNFTELTAELTARKKQYEYYRDTLLTFDVHRGGTFETKWRTLGEICDILTGYPFDSAQFKKSGVRLMRGMNIKRGGLVFDESIDRYWESSQGLEKYLLDAGDIVISMDGSLVGKSFGTVAKSDLPLLLVQRVARIRAVQANQRYVYHYISCKFPHYVELKKTKGAIPHISQKDIANFQIAIPDVEVQNKIAEVLDNFDAICSDLNIGLPAEIEARKKQYEYYRDMLLTFAAADDIILTDRQTDRQSLIKLLQYVFGYVVLPFGEIATIVRGASPRPIRSYITTDKDGVCWIKIGDVKPNTKYIVSTAEKITKEGAEKSRYVKKGDFILSNSMSFGRPYILKIDGCIHDGWLAISDYENWLLPDYLYHLLNSNEIRQEMKKKASFGGAVQNLNADIVRELELPIPSLEKQSDIVAVLDRFDTLCNDLTTGLPAEIEARQKQYEYYRDKLLTF